MYIAQVGFHMESGAKAAKLQVLKIEHISTRHFIALLIYIVNALRRLRSF